MGHNAGYQRASKAHYFGTVAAGLMLVISHQAWAQSATTSEGPTTEAIEEVVVTGTSIRGVKPVGSATLSVSAENLKKEGLVRPSDLTRILPQMQTSNIRETSANGIAGNSTRGQAFNLRGLGSGGTLLLVDGKRAVPNGAADAYQDANVIPFAAVERVEVVTDGASAVYGADAVGGVVNYILKRNYDGFQVRAQYGEQLGSPNSEINFLGGKNYTIGGRSGNLMASYRHAQRDAILRSASPFLSANLLRFGGNDNRINNQTVDSGRPGTLAVNTPTGFQYYAIPAGPGTGLTAASFTPGLGNINNSADNYTYLGDEEQDSATIYWNQDINDSLAVYVQGYYNKRMVKTRQGNNVNLNITNTPFRIPSLGGISQFVNYRFPDQEFKTFEETYSVTAGARIDLPGEWQGEAFTTYGDNENCGQCRTNFPNNNVFSPLLANGTFNPFNTDLASVPPFSYGLDIDRSEGTFTDTLVKADGPLFSLPAGQVRAAVGFEYSKLETFYENYGTNAPGGARSSNRPPVSLERTVKSAFAEVFVPLIAEGTVPFVHSLDLSAAVRRDDYSDFGSTTNPKVGVTWAATEDLSFRGTWGTSFKAPSIQAANSGTIGNSFFIQNFANGTGDPALPRLPGSNNSLVLLLAGGNPNLKAEEATTFSLGFDYAPRWFDGLRITTSYYNIDYKDRIAGPPAGNYLSTPENYARYKQFVTVAPQPSTCVSGDFSTYNPAYRAAIAEDPFTTLFQGLNPCQSVAILDGRTQNIGSVEQDGVDFQVQYQRDIAVGTLTSGFSVTKILNLKQSLIPNAPLVDVLDQINNPNSLRVRANLGLQAGGWRGNLFLNHIGGYLNNVPITLRTTPAVVLPSKKVDGWTTFDASLSYDFSNTDGVLKGVGMNLNVQNLADKDPPTVLSGNSAFDEGNANVFGRTFQIEIFKTF